MYLQDKCDISEGEVKFLINSDLVTGSSIADGRLGQTAAFQSYIVFLRQMKAESLH